MLRRTIIGLTLLSTLGCNSSTDKAEDLPPEGTDSGHTLVGDDTGSADDTGDSPSPSPVDISTDNGPCDGDTWGNIATPETSLHVTGDNEIHRLDSALTSDGSPSHPFRHFTEFLEYMETGDAAGITAVALWPGNFQLESDTLQYLSSHGMGMVACSPTETSIQPPDGSTSALLTVGSAASVKLQGLTLSTTLDVPVIAADGAASIELSNVLLSGGSMAALVRAIDTSSVVVTDSTLEGGSVGVWTNGNATSLTMLNSTISGSTQAGVWTNGNATSLQGVTISNILGSPGMTGASGGWGAMIGQGEFVASDLTIQNARQIGLFVSATDVDLSDVTISDIATTSAGTHGRGIHLAGTPTAPASMTLNGVDIQNVNDAGIFIRNVSNVSLSNLSINGVGAGSVDSAYSSIATGDGIVIVQRAEVDPSESLDGSYDDGEGMDPEAVTVSLTGDNHFTGILRAGIIADAAALSLDMLTTMETGLSEYGYPVFEQNCAVLTWLSDAPPSDCEAPPTDGYDGDTMAFDDDDVGPPSDDEDEDEDEDEGIPDPEDAPPID